jgi:hypothetical protein
MVARAVLLLVALTALARTVSAGETPYDDREIVKQIKLSAGAVRRTVPSPGGTRKSKALENDAIGSSLRELRVLLGRVKAAARRRADPKEIVAARNTLARALSVLVTRCSSYIISVKADRAAFERYTAVKADASSRGYPPQLKSRYKAAARRMMSTAEQAKAGYDTYIQAYDDLVRELDTVGPVVVKLYANGTCKPVALRVAKSAGEPKSRDVYVLKDGRRIESRMAIDAGDSYSIKTASGKMVIVKKSDVAEIVKEAPPADAAAGPTSATPDSDSASPPGFDVYVLKDGRRIAGKTVMDAGDEFLVKDSDGKLHTVAKSDLTEVVEAGSDADPKRPPPAAADGASGDTPRPVSQDGPRLFSEEL